MRWHRPAFGVGDDASFDSERFVIRNSYTGGSDHLKKPFGEAAKHRNPIYNDCCRADLDYARGDDFLQIGQLTLGSIGGYYLRTLGRFSSLSKLAHAWTGTPHLPSSVSMRRNYDTEAPNRG